MSDLFVPAMLNTMGGIQAVVPPGPNSGAPNGSKGPSVGLIDFNGDPQYPEVVTLSVFAWNPVNVAQNVGPIIGMLSFGSGQASQYAEFDIPALTNINGGAGVGTGGGVQLSFPASHVNFAVRNDAAVQPPPTVGPTQLPLSSNMFNASVACQLGSGSRPTSARIYRVIYGLMANLATGLAPGQTTAAMPVPAFASAYRVVHFPPTATIRVSEATNGLIITGGDSYLIAPNAVGPTLDLNPNTSAIFVTNDAASASNLQVAAVQYILNL